MSKYQIEKTKYAFSILKDWKIVSYNLRFANYHLTQEEIFNFIDNYEWDHLLEELEILNEKKFEENFLDLSDSLEEMLRSKEWIDRKMMFLWWLNKKLQDNWKWRTILVWWSAVEFWTNWNVKSFDIDVVYHTNEDIWEILQHEWFYRNWRYFSNDELKIYLECPWERLHWKKDPDIIYLDWKDTNALVISIEDLIIDRLEQYSQWNKECLDHIQMMILSKFEEIDFDFLKECQNELWLNWFIDFDLIKNTLNS